MNATRRTWRTLGAAVLMIVGCGLRDSTAPSLENLKQIAEAWKKYIAEHDARLPGDVLSKDGKQLLSWRVVLLPYLGEKQLYEQFRLEEPWDSPHNLPLVEKMPGVYASPRAKSKDKGSTVYQMFSGPGALHERGQPRFGIGNIPKGTSNLLLIVESSQAVPWTKPADIPYDKARPIPDFGRDYDNKPLGVLANGTARVLDLKKISAATLKNTIDPADGNELGRDWKE